jgi:protein tyrosine phosphatase
MKLNIIIIFIILGVYTPLINSLMRKRKRTKSDNCYANAVYKEFSSITECNGNDDKKVEDYASMDVTGIFNCLHKAEYVDTSGKATLSPECNSKNRFIGTYSYKTKALTNDDSEYLNSALFKGRIVPVGEEYVYNDAKQNGFIAATNAPIGDPADSKRMPIASQLGCPETLYSNNQNAKGEYVETGGSPNENSCLSGNTMSGTNWDKKNTILNFYNTLAAKNVNYIIQLTNFVEKMDEANKPCKCKVKADKYFGLDENEAFDIKDADRNGPSGATVTSKFLNSTKADLFGTQDYANGDVRELSFKAKADSSDYKVTHVHFRGWLDFGVPANDDRTALISLIKSIRKKMDEGKNVIVHCTGGIGRSGTFIASVLALDLKKNEGKKFNLAKFILELRKHRPELVETKTQLELIAKDIVGQPSSTSKK